MRREHHEESGMTEGPTYRLRYFFDAGSGVCLWAGNAAARARWGYPIDLDDLPLPADLRHDASCIVRWWDTAYDWDDPAGPSPWQPEEDRRFAAAAQALLTRLREHVGLDVEIVDESKTTEWL